MSSCNNFHLHFVSHAQSFDIDFQQQKRASPESVMIDGRHYVLRGDESQISWLKEKLPELNSSGMARSDLRIHLQSLGATEIDTATRIKAVASRSLGVVQNVKLPIFERTIHRVQSCLRETCPKGAGSMVMVSTPGDGAKIVTGGARTVGGGSIDGQTAALIGSGTKMFTALCSMALISKGVINKKTGQPLTLETKVCDVFSPRQMMIFDDQAKAQELTLGMLLSHTSGLVYHADDNRDDRSGQGLNEILLKKKPGSVRFYGHPGDRIYSYSNHIGLAAAMIEMICKKPYAEVLRETVLVPLGMDRTSYICPEDPNILLAYQPGKQGGQPTSTKMVVTDPMMQGAGGLWSCMDDMAKLGQALGRAVMSVEGGLTTQVGQVVISSENLQKMMASQAVNAPSGLALVLEGDVIGKGGGIHGYDFKFKLDTKTGNCISMMCNHAGQGDFGRYLETTETTLRALNPSITLPNTTKPVDELTVKIAKAEKHIERLKRQKASAKRGKTGRAKRASLTGQIDAHEQRLARLKKLEEVTELPISECPLQYRGFSGCLALPEKRPLTRINFNGTTLPVKALPVGETGLTERYVITGRSPFQGMELQIFEQNEHEYICLSNGVEEVWSFGKIEGTAFPSISNEELFELLAGASGNYDDKTPVGPDRYQVSLDAERGLTFSHSGMPLSKCLITAMSGARVSFSVCLGGGPQCISYRLQKGSDGWKLIVLNGETENGTLQELDEDPISIIPHS